MTNKYLEFYRETKAKLSFSEFKTIIDEFREFADIFGDTVTPDKIEEYRGTLNRKSVSIKMRVIDFYFKKIEPKKEIIIKDKPEQIEVKQVLPVKDPVGRFYKYLKASRSELTLKNYMCDITEFVNTISKPIINVSVSDIDDFRSKLNAKGNGHNTIVRKLNALNSLFKFLVTRDIIIRNPFDKIEIGAPKYKIFKAIEDSEVKKLFRSLNNYPDDYYHLIVGAVLSLLDTGARRFEIMGLKLKDVDLKNSRIKVILKRGSESTYVIPKRNLPLIEKYIEFRNQIITNYEEFLLWKKDGQYIPLNEYFLYDKILYPYQEKVIGKRINPHAFRHHFANLLADNGVNIRDIQGAMNHASPVTTLRYQSFKNRDSVVQNNHPRGG